MPTLTIKNIPEDVYLGLKEQATLHHRSLNSEVIVSLEQILSLRKQSVQTILKEARQVREKTVNYKVTEKKLKSTKEQGRP